MVLSVKTIVYFDDICNGMSIMVVDGMMILLHAKSNQIKITG